jgi:hypothetical protein
MYIFNKIKVYWNVQSWTTFHLFSTNWNWFSETDQTASWCSFSGLFYHGHTKKRQTGQTKEMWNFEYKELSIPFWSTCLSSPLKYFMVVWSFVNVYFQQNKSLLKCTHTDMEWFTPGKSCKKCDTKPFSGFGLLHFYESVFPLIRESISIHIIWTTHPCRHVRFPTWPLIFSIFSLYLKVYAWWLHLLIP